MRSISRLMQPGVVKAVIGPKLKAGGFASRQQEAKIRAAILGETAEPNRIRPVRVQANRITRNHGFGTKRPDPIDVVGGSLLTYVSS